MSGATRRARLVRVASRVACPAHACCRSRCCSCSSLPRRRRRPRGRGARAERGGRMGALHDPGADREGVADGARRAASCRPGSTSSRSSRSRGGRGATSRFPIGAARVEWKGGRIPSGRVRELRVPGLESARGARAQVGSDAMVRGRHERALGRRRRRRTTPRARRSSRAAGRSRACIATSAAERPHADAGRARQPSTERERPKRTGRQCPDDLGGVGRAGRRASGARPCRARPRGPRSWRPPSPCRSAG